MHDPTRTVAGWLVCLTLTAGASRAGLQTVPQVAPEAYKPVWRVGLSWQVETVGLQTAARRDPVAGRPATPVRWQFEVVDSEPVDEAPCFKVRVTCRAAGPQPETIIWVDQQSMTLRRVTAQLPAPDGFRTVTETYRSASGQPFPALTPLSVPPLELPLFLAGMKGSQSFDYSATSGPEGVKAVGGLDFAWGIEQQLSIPPPEDLPTLVPEDFTKSPERKPTIEVRLKAGKIQIRQLWQPGVPWPVYSDNGAIRARLVQVDE